LWFDKKNHTYPWYIGSPDILGKLEILIIVIERLNERINAIQTPHHWRKPLKVDKRSHWKAIDYKDWAIYYSLFVLKGLYILINVNCQIFFLHIIIFIGAN